MTSAVVVHLALLLGLVLCLCPTLGTTTPHLVLSWDATADHAVTLPCADGMDYVSLYGAPAGCVSSFCGRRVVDDLFSHDDIAILKGIVEKGMGSRAKLGGPTILDINTGFIRDSKGLANLFLQPEAGTSSMYTEEDFAHYGSIIKRLKGAVSAHFGLDTLYFTTPTFITRLDGNATWEPEGVHDEYWHRHVDRENTEHYHYSGLLYMSDFGTDFTGGLLHFYSASTPSEVELTVEPRAGRVVIFTAGSENPHMVERVTSGDRLVLSFWFTCNVKREFEIFLDGAAHVAFSEKTKAQLLRQQQQQQQQQQRQGQEL